MKTFSQLMISDLSYRRRQLSVSQTALSLTNASCIWRPGDKDLADSQGYLAAVQLKLSNRGNFHIGIRISAKYPDGKYRLSGYHIGPARLTSVLEPKPIDIKDYVYLEIALNPKTSNVTFWTNDTGLDLGRLEGFADGAYSATWEGSVTQPDMGLICGQFSQCAYATSTGWSATTFNQARVEKFGINRHDQIKVLAPDHVSFGDKRMSA